MKTLIKGILALIGSIFIFSIVIAIGIIYSPFKAIHLSFTKKWYSGIEYILKLYVISVLHFTGRFLYNLAIDYDILANEWAEWIEDTLTHVEKTQFGAGKQNTISASIGHLFVVVKQYFKTAVITSKVLNFVFWQKEHCIGSWLYFVERKKIEKRYFEKK